MAITATEARRELVSLIERVNLDRTEVDHIEARIRGLDVEGRVRRPGGNKLPAELPRERSPPDVGSGICPRGRKQLLTSWRDPHQSSDAGPIGFRLYAATV